MKIGPEHVSRIVTGNGFIGTHRVLGVGDDKVLLKDLGEAAYEWMAPSGPGWQLVEETKKPSERITEIFERMEPIASGILRGQEVETKPEAVAIHWAALMRYLDEQFEKGVLK